MRPCVARRYGKRGHGNIDRRDLEIRSLAFQRNGDASAAGPDFKLGELDDLPTGNTDLAPTILQILGIKPPMKMDGRVLSESMTNSDPATATPKPETKTIDAKKDLPSGSWRQSVRISRVGSATYLDEGNGTFVPKR